MRGIRIPLFGRTKDLANKIDEFLDQVSEAGLVLEQGIVSYMDGGFDESCVERQQQISLLEARGDALRRGVQATMYTEMLIPEWRGDVLRLLYEMDRLLNVLKASFMVFTIERPEVPDEFKNDFKELARVVTKCVDHVVLASRAYFREISALRDHVHKVSFHESEADRVAIRLKEGIFRSSLPLAHKMQLRDAVNAIDAMADQAEDVGDSLAIFAIKRAL